MRNQNDFGNNDSVQTSSRKLWLKSRNRILSFWKEKKPSRQMKVQRIQIKKILNLFRKILCGENQKASAILPEIWCKDKAHKNIK